MSKLFSRDVCRHLTTGSCVPPLDMSGVQSGVGLELEGAVPLRGSTSAHQEGADTTRLADTFCPFCGRKPQSEATVRVPILIACVACCGQYELLLTPLVHRPAHASQTKTQED